MLRPAVRGSGHGDLLFHASIIGVFISLEHKIEEDSTDATDGAEARPLRKLTYNKMCPCTINLVKKKKKKRRGEKSLRVL